MKKILSGLCASMLAVTFGMGTLAPAAAAPLFAPMAIGSSSDVHNVQSRQDWRREGGRVDNRGRFERRGGRAYYNGHRGYDQPRRGYRQHNGVWFPAAAFIAGAILGGALDNQPRVQSRSRSSAHVEWCYDRYRSYRASDNTFQPNSGPRRQCIPS